MFKKTYTEPCFTLKLPENHNGSYIDVLTLERKDKPDCQDKTEFTVKRYLNFRKGQLFGFQKCVYLSEKETLYLTGTFRNGISEGQFQEYNTEELLEVQEHYKEGFYEGSRILYKDGRVIKRYFWKNKELMEFKVY